MPHLGTLLTCTLFACFLLPTLQYRKNYHKHIRRRCYPCPKPLQASILSGQLSTEELATNLNVTSTSSEVAGELTSNSRLAEEMMDTFSGVRCFAMFNENGIFSDQDIQRINDVMLSLSEINMNPTVCVYDKFSVDCGGVDTSNNTLLNQGIEKLLLLLNVLLQNTEEK